MAIVLVAAILTALDKTEDEYDHINFLHLLGRIPSDESLPALLENLHHADVSTRIAAAERVVAVGTTTVRVLESLACGAPLEGRTTLFVTPGFAFRRVDALVTNFHLPRSTLLMLVCAFGGYERVMAVYREAVREGYRFYSYGDAMAIV